MLRLTATTTQSVQRGPPLLCSSENCYVVRGCLAATVLRTEIAADGARWWAKKRERQNEEEGGEKANGKARRRKKGKRWKEWAQVTERGEREGERRNNRETKEDSDVRKKEI